ncbi:hypothetical protein E1091_00205 [Micromonospora fluostatini]|uniref:Uncharacterized protein n=1 Tax=Micromonospora fluostatini TaxID=1629071 RepID=A0ABY2DS51_9ACTN|nr:hypothetical protein E1091_00205 [Micromonospora fluostatini]
MSEGMTRAEEEVANKAAHFWPQGDHAVDGTRPAIEVAGAMVFAYVEGGELWVSVDLDETDSRLTREDNTVPLRVTVQGTQVFVADGLPKLV